MKIEVDKKYFFTIAGAILLIVGILGVFAYTKSIPDPGHGGNSVLISINDQEKTIQQAIDDGDFGGLEGSADIFGRTISLQEALLDLYPPPEESLCGNGIIDVEAGEVCDGTTLPSDLPSLSFGNYICTDCRGLGWEGYVYKKKSIVMDNEFFKVSGYQRSIDVTCKQGKKLLLWDHILKDYKKNVISIGGNCEVGYLKCFTATVGTDSGIGKERCLIGCSAYSGNNAATFKFTCGEYQYDRMHEPLEAVYRI